MRHTNRLRGTLLLLLIAMTIACSPQPYNTRDFGSPPSNRGKKKTGVTAFNAVSCRLSLAR